MLADMNSPRIPTSGEAALAVAYLAANPRRPSNTRDAQCVCDPTCGTHICDACRKWGAAVIVRGAYNRFIPLRPAAYWPMQGNPAEADVNELMTAQ
jgi:hypothetical protein